MNPDLAFEIVALAVSLAKSQIPGRVQQDATVADILLKIVQKGVEAYRQHSGEALDLSLIKAEEPA
jgi:hypothetical protein